MHSHALSHGGNIFWTKMFWSNYPENSPVTTLARVHGFARCTGRRTWTGGNYTCVRGTSDDNKTAGGNFRSTSGWSATEVFAGFPRGLLKSLFCRQITGIHRFNAESFHLWRIFIRGARAPRRSLSPFHLELLNYTYLINVARTLYHRRGSITHVDIDSKRR